MRGGRKTQSQARIMALGVFLPTLLLRWRKKTDKIAGKSSAFGLSISCLGFSFFRYICINNFPTYNDTKSHKEKVYLCKMLNIPPQFESEEWNEGICSHNKSLILVWDNARIWKIFYTFWWCLFYHLIFFPSSFCCAVY